MRMTGWLGWRRTVVVGLLLLAGLLQACTSNDATKGPTFPSTIVGGGGAGTIAVLILSANPNTVACGGTSTITAKVLNDNAVPVPGVQVVFGASRGRLSATTALTDESGHATVTWLALASLIEVCVTGGASGDIQDVTIEATAGLLGVVSVAVTVFLP